MEIDGSSGDCLDITMTFVLRPIQVQVFKLRPNFTLADEQHLKVLSSQPLKIQGAWRRRHIGGYL